jgi:hypothetical protein
MPSAIPAAKSATVVAIGRWCGEQFRRLEPARFRACRDCRRNRFRAVPPRCFCPGTLTRGITRSLRYGSHLEVTFGRCDTIESRVSAIDDSSGTRATMEESVHSDHGAPRSGIRATSRRSGVKARDERAQPSSRPLPVSGDVRAPEGGNRSAGRRPNDAQAVRRPVPPEKKIVARERYFSHRMGALRAGTGVSAV